MFRFGALIKVPVMLTIGIYTMYQKIGYLFIAGLIMIGILMYAYYWVTKVREPLEKEYREGGK